MIHRVNADFDQHPVVKLISVDQAVSSRDFRNDMKKIFCLVFFVTSALLGRASSSLAETLQGYGVVIDKQFALGWVLAECQAYRDNMIPASRLSNTFSRIGLDQELSDSEKFEIFQTVQAFSKCADVFSQWAK